jgi:hypothetical protein
MEFVEQMLEVVQGHQDQNTHNPEAAEDGHHLPYGLGDNLVQPCPALQA